MQIICGACWCNFTWANYTVLPGLPAQFLYADYLVQCSLTCPKSSVQIYLVHLFWAIQLPWASSLVQMHNLYCACLLCLPTGNKQTMLRGKRKSRAGSSNHGSSTLKELARCFMALLADVKIMFCFFSNLCSFPFFTWACIGQCFNAFVPIPLFWSKNIDAKHFVRLLVDFSAHVLHVTCANYLANYFPQIVARYVLQLFLFFSIRFCACYLVQMAKVCNCSVSFIVSNLYCEVLLGNFFVQIIFCSLPCSIRF